MGLRKEFGNFLKESRLERKFTNVEEYAKAYWRSTKKFATSYYRNLEAGAQLPRLAKGLELCNALRLDKVVFLRKLMRSQLAELPLSQEEIDEIIPDISEETAEAKVVRLEREMQDLRNRELIDQIDDQVVLSDDSVNYFTKHKSTALFWLSGAIYMSETVSFAELDRFIEKHKSELPYGLTREQVIFDFTKLGLIAVNTEQQFIQRRAKFFTTQTGISLKTLLDLRLWRANSEILRSFQSENQLRKNDKLSPDIKKVSMMLSYQICIGKNTIKRLNELKDQFVRICEAEDETELEYGTTPFHLALNISSREEFNIKNL